MKRILTLSALFPPESVVSSNLAYDIATDLAYRDEVTVISTFPSRPNGMYFNEDVTLADRKFNHVRLKSYISRNSSIYSRFKESYSFGKLTAKFIETNHKQIDIIYVNTWPLAAQYLTIKVAKKYCLQNTGLD